MKTAITMTALLFIALTSSVTAQDFTFNYNMKELDEVQQVNDIKKHFLGEEVATKLQLLKETYTYKEKDPISLSERTVVEKTAIYNSIKKLSKYYKKQLKTGTVTKEDATTQMVNALNIALNIRYQSTEELEDLLWDIKDPKQLTSLYTSQVKLDF
ncbi:MAG: hypothetical protein JXQ90_06840 [Cyclobacteriaceae bacterium]